MFHNAGIERADGTFEVMLERNTPLPCSITKSFETAEEKQRGVTINIYEGKVHTKNHGIKRY